MSLESFTPVGKTTALAVTASSQAVVIDYGTATSAMANQFICTVVGSQPVTLAYDVTAPTAITPTAGTPTQTVVLPADSTQTFTFPYKSLLAAIAPATGSTLYLTVGTGV